MKIQYKNQTFSLEINRSSTDLKEILINDFIHKMKLSFEKEIHSNASLFIFEDQNQHYKAIITEGKNELYVSINGRNFVFIKYANESKSINMNLNIHEILAPLPGTLSKLNVKKDQTVKQGEVLLIIESMKMENQILCPRDAIIEEIFVKEGQKIETNQLLIKLS